jgi:FAD:protein FMN transferase
MRWSRALAAFFPVLLIISLAECQSPGAVYKKKYAMGTVFEVVAYGEPRNTAAAIDAAFDEVIRLDGILSNYKPGSELSRLNRTAHFHAVAVSADLYRVIEESLKYSTLSHGEFDITVGPLVNYWKSVMRGEKRSSSSEVEKLRACTGYDKIVLTPPDQVEFRSDCMQIDVGAIGKGYAVDRMVAILRSSGVTSAFINAGGSTTYGLGSPPDQAGWRVRLRDPSGKNEPEIVLRDNSVSTSEQTARDVMGDSKAGHIIDPKTGEPIQTAAALSAVAGTGTDSDALSTTLLLLGPKEGMPLVKSIAGTAAIWISSAGEVESASSGPKILFGGTAAKITAQGHQDQ